MSDASRGREYPDWLSATLASDATEGRGVLANWIRALREGARLVGPAFVVLASEDDNQAGRVAMGGAFPQGCVLVVGGAEHVADGYAGGSDGAGTEARRGGG